MQHNISLKERNSFHFDISTKKYSEINNSKTLQEAIINKDIDTSNVLILGGGSNILFNGNYQGHILHPTETSSHIEKTIGNDVYIKASAGIEWDSLVEQTVNSGLSGLENLSLIPGQVGASPVQNIGAYGIEAKDCIEFVEGFYLNTGKTFKLHNSECQFGYRESIFKKELKGKIFISHVTFKLSKNNEFHLDYGALKEQVENKGAITLRNIRQSVIDIRKEKLPEPHELGNAGSFFKNPVVCESTFLKIKGKHPELKFFKQFNGYKIPAGWLIDKAGWKGYRKGDAGVHKNQALVLVNYGNARPNDILELSNMICRDIQEKFNISLEKEVTIV